MNFFNISKKYPVLQIWMNVNRREVRWYRDFKIISKWLILFLSSNLHFTSLRFTDPDLGCPDSNKNNRIHNLVSGTFYTHKRTHKKSVSHTVCHVEKVSQNRFCDNLKDALQVPDPEMFLKVGAGSESSATRFIQICLLYITSSSMCHRWF